MIKICFLKERYNYQIDFGMHYVEMQTNYLKTGDTLNFNLKHKMMQMEMNKNDKYVAGKWIVKLRMMMDLRGHLM